MFRTNIQEDEMDKIFELNRTHGDYMKRKTKSRLLKIDMNLKNFLVHFTNWILPDLDRVVDHKILHMRRNTTQIDMAASTLEQIKTLHTAGRMLLDHMKEYKGENAILWEGFIIGKSSLEMREWMRAETRIRQNHWFYEQQANCICRKYAIPCSDAPK